MKRIFLGLALLMMCFNSACSRLDWAFNNADMFLAFKVDDYFNITSSQKKELKSTFNKDLDRIRKEKLPELSAQLKKVDRDLSTNKFDRARLAQVIQYSWSTYEDVMGEFSATTEGLVSSLRPDQVNYFIKVSQKKIQEDKEVLGDQKDFLKKGRKTYARVLEMFFGDLTSQQRDLLDQHLRKTAYFHELKIKNREELVSKLSQERGSLDSQKTIVKDFYSGKTPKSAELAQGEKQFEKDLEAFIGQMLESLSPGQKAKLKANLQDKAQQLDRLAS